MEDFVVSARKYRPKTFESVVGQQSITNTLLKAIENHHLAQAFLFCGPRGVGKTTCARILAKEVNHFNSENTQENEDFAFNIFELDAASNNSVEDIRNLIDQVRVPPQIGKYKVYIIDEVHMLSQAAFNAFLKTLEEPPPYAIFILATTEKHKILPTILSRCQIFDFNRISIQDMAAHLAGIADKEGIEAEPDALHIIAQKADGALRDALSIFDQVVSFAGNKVTYDAVIENLNILDYDYYFKVSEAIIQQNITSVLMVFDSILKKGFDGHNFLVGLAAHLRNLLVCQNPSTIKLLEVGENIKEKYQEQSSKIPLPLLLEGLKILSAADVQFRGSKNQRLLVELALMELCSLTAETQQKKKSSRFIAEPIDELIRKTLAGERIDTFSFESIAAAPVEAEKAGKASYKLQEPVLQTADEQVITPKDVAKEYAVKEPPGRKKVSRTGRLAGLKRREGISLNAIATHGGGTVESEVQEEEEKTDYSNYPSTPFNMEQLWKVWDRYTDKVKADKRMSLYATLTKRKPILKDNFRIELLLDNDVQEQDLNTEKADILSYLRQELKNWSISLEGIIEEETDDDVHLYTPEEKFKAMVAKNPALGKLKQRYDLDIEYDG